MNNKDKQIFGKLILGIAIIMLALSFLFPWGEITLGFIGDMIRKNQNLHEDILYRLKKNGSSKKHAAETEYVEMIEELDKP